MNMPLRKSETAVATLPALAAKVLPLPSKRGTFQSRAIAKAGEIAVRVLPPLVMLAIILGVWQLLCMKPGATLPAPTKIWTEAKDLIIDPFFVAGPQDIGLGWRVLTSLQRVAIGYGFAALFGILLGTIIGQSVWAMRGLDPIFQVLRKIGRAHV